MNINMSIAGRLIIGSMATLYAIYDIFTCSITDNNS